MEMLEITDVKTKNDVHRIFAQKCLYTGYNVTFLTFLFGVLTVPLGFGRIKAIPIVPKEYKIFTGIFLCVGVSFSAGIYCKKRCQRRIIRELEERNLGHLVEDIEI